MLHISIVTPHGVVYDDDALEIILPTSTGEVGILPNHQPLYSVLEAGEIQIKKSNAEVYIAVSGGVLHVKPGSIVEIIADTAERAEHIDLERAEAARARAYELMKDTYRLQDEEFARLAAKLQKELARLKVGRKHRRLPEIK